MGTIDTCSYVRCCLPKKKKKKTGYVWRAPLYLGSLYARLGDCSQHVFKSIEWYDVALYIEASFLQMFLRERFGALSPVVVKFEPMKPQKVSINGVGREKTSHHKPRVIRWSGLKPEEGRKPLSK